MHLGGIVRDVLVGVGRTGTVQTTVAGDVEFRADEKRAAARGRGRSETRGRHPDLPIRPGKFVGRRL